MDSIIRKRKQSIKLLDELVKSKFVEMFGDEINIINKWECIKFCDAIEFMTSGPRGWAKYYSKIGQMFLTIQNVKNCQIDTQSLRYISPPDNKEAVRAKVQEGDILVSITADLGRTGVVTKEIAGKGAYINQHLSCIRLNERVINPYFITFFIEFSNGKYQILKRKQYGVKEGLNFEAISNLSIPVPPMQLQQKFARIFLKINQFKTELLSQIVSQGKLKSGIVQEYFTN